MLQETINHIEEQLNKMKEGRSNMKVCSFAAEIGVLITGEEADFVLNLLKSKSKESDFVSNLLKSGNTESVLVVPGDPLYFGFNTEDDFAPDLEANL